MLKQPDHYVFPSYRYTPQGAATCVNHTRCVNVNNKCAKATIGHFIDDFEHSTYKTADGTPEAVF